MLLTIFRNNVERVTSIPPQDRPTVSNTVPRSVQAAAAQILLSISAYSCVCATVCIVYGLLAPNL